MSFSRNIGRFLIIIGVLSLVIYFLTQSAGQGVMDYCLVGIAALVLGGLLMRRGREPEQPSQRFRSYRRRRARGKKQDDEMISGWEAFTDDGTGENE